MPDKHRILILGGGFAGLYTALELQETVGDDPTVEVTMVNRENFFLFTPMLHEVAASDLDVTHIVNPARKLLQTVRFVEGELLKIDLERKAVEVAHGADGHPHQLEFDQLVLALGSQTSFFGLPGVEEHALRMKSLEDAFELRNRIIGLLEEADTECSHSRADLLTIVVAGAGFAGVETLASINDFMRGAVKYYPNLSESELRLVLVHPGEVILPELSPSLGRYAQRKLEERGIAVLSGSRVASYDGTTVKLANGEAIRTKTLIWTAGTVPHALTKTFPFMHDRGRIKVTPELAVPDFPGVWAAGDCALVPDLTTGKFCPPTAQHALRQGRVLARNILAWKDGGEFQPFVFKTIGQLATIGRRAGVASVFGWNFSGFIAWWMWRTIYLSKLPRLEKKVRVALDWTLDLVFSKDLCQYTHTRKCMPSMPMEEQSETVATAAS